MDIVDVGGSPDVLFDFGYDFVCGHEPAVRYFLSLVLLGCVTAY